MRQKENAIIAGSRRQVERRLLVACEYVWVAALGGDTQNQRRRSLKQYPSLRLRKERMPHGAKDQ